MLKGFTLTHYGLAIPQDIIDLDLNCLNSGVVYSKPSLAQVLSCWKFGARAFSEQMLISGTNLSINFFFNIINHFSTKCIWKCHVQNVDYFIQIPICEVTDFFHAMLYDNTEVQFTHCNVILSTSDTLANQGLNESSGLILCPQNEKEIAVNHVCTLHSIRPFTRKTR